MRFLKSNRRGTARALAFRVNRPKLGFTLTEILVVITIIGILAALLIPAIQAARESARRMECANHLKQLSMACVNHESAQHHFPTGGWPWNAPPNPSFINSLWMGDPDLGYGKKQPGGWTYNILPFMDSKSLHDHGLGMSATQKKVILASTAQTVLGVFYCPSRRNPVLCPNTQAKIWIPHNIDLIPLGAYGLCGKLGKAHC